MFFCLVLPGAIVLLPARRAAAKFDAAINLKTAKTLSLTIPLSVLARADEAASQRRHGSNPCFVMVAFSPLFPPLPCRASREGEPIGSDFTNFHAGCHGPVPLETTIGSEDVAID